MKVLEGGRIGIAAQALGLASGALERATAYAKERKLLEQKLATIKQSLLNYLIWP